MLGTRRLRQRALLAGLVTLGVAFGAYSVAIGLFDANLQALTYDSFINNAPGKLSNQITIVAIDEATLARYGQKYPLPRQAYVDLLAALKPLEPRTVAFDVGFYDDSPNPDQDRALAVAIKDAGNVILAMQGAGSSIVHENAAVFRAETLPIPMFRSAAAALAAVNIQPDSDGRVRRAQLVIETPSGRYYALPLVATARSLAGKQIGGDERAIKQTDTTLVLPGRAGLADRVIPVDRSATTTIYYAAKPATDLAEQAKLSAPCAHIEEFCVVSLADVVSGRVARALIANRTVFVGVHSVSAIPDNYPVPNSAGTKMYGVEIWANTAASILANRFPLIHEDLVTTLLELLAAVGGGILLVARFRLFGFIAALGVLVLYGFVRFIAYSTAASDVAGQGPLPVASLGYLAPAAFWWVIALGYLLVEEQRAVTRTQATFGRFVTPSIARTIMDREERGSLALGGEEKRVTVLFGDVRGFTTLSEGLAPRVLLDNLNRYFEGIVGVVNRYEGTVNKYNGDNIMVLWGAPLDVEDPARKAVQCALEIQQWIVAEREKGGPDVSFGFGINTGPVVAGFLGALGRMEYTVIGDTANVASRLTSNDIARRDQVAVSGATLAELGDDVTVIDLGAIPVKGRAEPVACYQVDRIGTIASPRPAPPPERPILSAAVAGAH